MPDLRTVSIPERRALSAEAERRARAGEAPGAIRAALGLSTRAYSSWAKLFGFRQCDLNPGRPRPGAPPRHEPGPGGYARSGRTLREMPVPEDDARRIHGPDHPAWRGGAEAKAQRRFERREARSAAYAREVDALGSAAEVLVAVRDALVTDDTARADRLLSAWKQAARRARDLVALEAAAAREQAAGTGDGMKASVDADLTDEELCSHLERLTGRRIMLED